MRLADHPKRERVLTAKMSGTIARWLEGWADDDETIARLQELSVDPHLLAHGAGSADSDHHDRVRDLLERAGADMAILDAHAEELAAWRSPIAAVADGLNSSGRHRGTK